MATLHDFQRGRALALQGEPFSAYIQAAMRKADTLNNVKLKEAFPEEWADLEARYNSPGGRLPGESS